MTFITVADGLPGLIFQQLYGGHARQMGHDLPTIYLYGQSVQPNRITLPTYFRAVGVYFYPNALQAVFGLPAHEWTNACIGLELLDGHAGAALAERLLNTANTDECVAVLADYLYRRVLANEALQDPEAIYAMKRIRQSSGRVDLQALRDDLRISERGFARKFREAIGIPPKLFSRICQFQAALEQVRAGRFDRLTDVAFAHGYADQSHFIRSFKEFTGVPPMRFCQAFAEKLPNFPQRIQ